MMTFSLIDMGTAYRKAKVDLYYSTNPSLDRIAAYETDLEDNLTDLLVRINGESESWVHEVDFLGSYTFLPKSVRFTQGEEFLGSAKFSNPGMAWRNKCNEAQSAESAPPVAEFRLMAECTLDFHVLSSLWISKVGHKFDRELSTSAYGSRLRRRKDKEINSLSLGSFAPYLGPFQKWRDSGLGAMRSALMDA